MFYYDDKLKGFGVRVSGSVKSYIVQRRINGKKVRLKIGTHPDITAEQARAEAAKLVGDFVRDIDPRVEKKAKQAKTTTLAELFNQYKSARTLRPKTITIYDAALRRCFPDWLNKPITEVTKDMVQKRHDEISNKNGPRGKGEAQANQAMRVLRSLINYASSVYEDSKGRPLIVENPVRRLSQAKLWNRNKRRTDFIQKADLKPWFTEVLKLENTKVRDFLLVCLLTGMRRNEVAQLKWTDVDLKSKLLRIPADRTKNYDEHQLPLSDYLEELLTRRSKENEALEKKSEYVFSGKGKTGHLVEPKESVKIVVKDSKVKFMVHGLRRTFLTVGESLDIPHYTLKRLANHRVNGDVTGGYIQLTVDRLREPMQRITDAILQYAGIRNAAKAEGKTSTSE
jgi:integrase